MKIAIESFSQDVSLEDPDSIEYFFVVKTDDGRVGRLPVGKETTEALIEFVYGNSTTDKLASDSEEADELEDQEVEEEIGPEVPPEPMRSRLYQEDFPESEEEIQSI